MTDHKFTDEQIIEALEIRMPHDAVCREAYDLINRQKVEIESLKIANEKMYSANKDMQAAIERLEKSLADQFDGYENIRKKAKSEAIKEYVHRLKRVLGRIPQYHFTRSEVEWSINTLEKEMTEERK